jgi:hypothetical protein
MRTIMILSVVMIPAILTAQAGHSCKDHAMHQHMQKTQDMMEKMTECAERAAEMKQVMAQHREQHQERHREQFQIMEGMGESMEIIAGEMTVAAEKMGRMEADEALMNDPDMQREMTCLREHLGNMGDQMQLTLQIMERITNRLGQSEGDK